MHIWDLCIQKCRKIRGLGYMNRTRAMAQVTQPTRSRIFLHICRSSYKKRILLAPLGQCRRLFQPQPDGECHTIPKANIRLPFPILPQSAEQTQQALWLLFIATRTKHYNKIGEKLRELSAAQINILHPYQLMKSAAPCNSSNNEQSVKSESLIGKKGNEYT